MTLFSYLGVLIYPAGIYQSNTFFWSWTGLIFFCSNIVSVIVSLFSAMYVMKWIQFFPSKEFKYPPCFDGRAVCYPSSEILRDYLAWRQVDCEPLSPSLLHTLFGFLDMICIALLLGVYGILFLECRGRSGCVPLQWRICCLSSSKVLEKDTRMIWKCTFFWDMDWA